MNLRPLLVTAAVSIAVMLVASVVAWVQLPADAQVPIHWNLAGEADGYAPKAVGLLLTPAIAIILTAILAAIPAIEPRRSNLARSGTAYTAITGTAVAFIGLVHLAVVWAALGNSLDIPRLMGAGIGVLFIVIGNFMGKTRSNWFMGVRTPWTLSSELSWTRTHRLAGRLFALVGVLALLVAITGIPELIFGVIGGGTIVTVVVVVVYSYLVWRDDPERHTDAAEAER
jgi:uncharacterized membrane protein